MNILALALLPLGALPSDVVDRFMNIAGSPGVVGWKKEMCVNALNGKVGESGVACLVFYHPRERKNGVSSGNGGKWRFTREGTLVKPGVASCTVKNWSKWGGKYIWFEGVGIHHIEDNFPESSKKFMFDVASPEAFPGQTYNEWLWDNGRARFARSANPRMARFIVLKGVGPD